MDGQAWLQRWYTILGKFFHPRSRKPLSLLLHRVNCRLPQTPRSPSAVASHYFDDIFTRSARPRSSGRPSIRRSSTSRSIGARSDFGSAFNGETPDTPSADDEEPDRRNEHVSNYVESQIQRVRRRASVGMYEDELETQADHANGQWCLFAYLQSSIYKVENQQEGTHVYLFCIDKPYFIVLYCCFCIHHSTSILEIAKSNISFLHIQFRWILHSSRSPTLNIIAQFLFTEYVTTAAFNQCSYGQPPKFKDDNILCHTYLVMIHSPCRGNIDMLRRRN